MHMWMLVPTKSRRSYWMLQEVVSCPAWARGNQRFFGRGLVILATEAALYPPWEDWVKHVQRHVTSVCLSSSCHSQLPGPLQTLTFVLNTESIVLGTGNWVAVNSHINSSGRWLFTAPLATHGRPETDEGGVSVRRMSLGWNQFFSSVSWVSRYLGSSWPLAKKHPKRNMLHRQRSRFGRCVMLGLTWRHLFSPQRQYLWIPSAIFFFFFILYYGKIHQRNFIFTVYVISAWARVSEDQRTAWLRSHLLPRRFLELRLGSKHRYLQSLLPDLIWVLKRFRIWAREKTKQWSVDEVVWFPAPGHGGSLPPVTPVSGQPKRLKKNPLTLYKTPF